MDIRNKPSLHTHLKRFTLTATTSAILALNSEHALATSCAIYITSDLAGIACNLTTAASTTVTNNGTIGSILVDQNTNASSITIDNGGLINGSSSNNVGISLTSTSSLSNGITNNGTISLSNGIGIEMTSNSTIQGGISNNGIIQIDSGSGIYFHQGKIDGGISNSGTIQSGGSGGGIGIANNSTIGGSIFNNGLINATGSRNGINIASGSLLTGNISNQGTIQSISNYGINITDTTVSGNILNHATGTIYGGGVGFALSNASILSGSIFNDGSITGETEGVTIHGSLQISGDITNNGTIKGITSTGFGLGSNAAIQGNITNTGTIQSVSATGISIQSSAVVQGGITNSGTIQGATKAINISSDSSVSNFDIVGTKARIIGDVEATRTNVNLNQNAIFTSEGDYNVESFNIAQNAFFNMANSMTTTSGLNNTGTLAIANQQTLVGDYTQNSGGLFQTTISDSNHYGQLSATGLIDLSQSGDMYVNLNQNASLKAGDTLSNIINGNILITPNNDFHISDNSYIWNFVPTLNNTNTGLNLTASINPEVYQICQGMYCQGASTAIVNQIAAGNSTFAPYATLSTANALQQAASQATPELTNENMQVIQFITRSVLDIVPMWDPLRGKSSGDAMLYQPGKLWVKPYGGAMTQNERNTIPGFNSTVYGAVIGKDIQITNDVLLGGAFAAGGDNMRGNAVLNGQSIHSSTYQAIAYSAQKLSHHFYIAEQGLIGYQLNESSREIPLFASTAKGSFNSWFTNLRAEAGWSTSILNPNLIITPEIDASYLFINQNNYQEYGSPMNLSVSSNNNASLVLGAYGNAAYHLTTTHNEHNLTFTGYAGLAGDVLNNQPTVSASFLASGTGFSTFGIQPNGTVFRGGLGLDFTSQTKPITMALNYDLQAGNNAYSGVGTATIKYKR